MGLQRLQILQYSVLFLDCYCYLKWVVLCAHIVKYINVYLLVISCEIVVA